jgi:hypothetical protein
MLLFKTFLAEIIISKKSKAERIAYMSAAKRRANNNLEEQLSLTTKAFNYGNPAYSVWFWIKTKTSLVFQKVGSMCCLLEPFIRDALKTQKDRIR